MTLRVSAQGECHTLSSAESQHDDIMGLLSPKALCCVTICRGKSLTFTWPDLTVISPEHVRCAICKWQRGHAEF